jgi:hypothetical protein
MKIKSLKGACTACYPSLLLLLLLLLLLKHDEIWYCPRPVGIGRNIR